MAIRQSLTAIPERPRCKQSVAQHCSIGRVRWRNHPSDAGGLLLGRLDRGLGLILASCFTDRRDPRLLEHTVETLVGQRVFALALGYEDLNDHDEFVTTRCSMCWPASSRPSVRTVRRWPARARSTGWSTGRGARPGSITRSITMRRAWKHCSWTSPRWPQASAEGRARPRRHRRHDPRRARRSVLPWLTAIATIYIFCGRFLLGAKLRPANIDGAAGAVDEVARIVARIRARWPKVRIVLRGDSGFCREELMAWCEAEGVAYVRPGAQCAQGGAGARGLGGSAVMPNHGKRLGCSGISP